MVELEAARYAFRSVLDSMPESSWSRASANPPWTNGQVLFHITLAYILLPFLVPTAQVFGRLPTAFSGVFAGLLDAGTGLFNWANRLAPLAGGQVYSRDRLLSKYDSLHTYAVRTLSRLDPNELQRGMFYPHKWHSMFHGYMTLWDVFRYPAIHLTHHLGQIIP